jgi:hypothetical protein
MMKLDEIFTPPQMSSTISKTQQSGGANKQDNGTEPSAGEQGGRPELPQDEKSDKTIANEESQG